MRKGVTRTYNPLHFEDLEPKRFEDLIRQLIYDFRDWETIEPTGAGGSDDGFDIRAYEKVEPTDDQDENIPSPMEGNEWMIQVKREKVIGPAKLKEILDDVSADNPPYGYILAASAKFSKKSHDLFRKVLLEKGVSKFYLWGNQSLEDLLYQSNNDRILFTFFGISFHLKKRNVNSEIRYKIVKKNQLFAILGRDFENHRSILIRNTHDSAYPKQEAYDDFETFRRWGDYELTEFTAKGILVKIGEYFAYVDRTNNEFDYVDDLSLVYREIRSQEQKDEIFEKRDLIEPHWKRLASYNKAKFCTYGEVLFTDIVALDKNGDHYFDMPHIYIDYEKYDGPFANFYETLEGSEGGLLDINLEEYKKTNFFPEKFKKVKQGKFHKDKDITVERYLIHRFEGRGFPRKIYDVDGKLSYLNVGDIIKVSEENNGEKYIHIEITHIGKYKYTGSEPYKHSVEEQIKKDLKKGNEIIVYEFELSYDRRIY